jgi:ADP-heptose:LPS heptosyltransferase
VRLARLRDERGRVEVLAGRTDLVGLAATVAAARAVLCGDTGVAHLATAYGRPSVVVFGPTPPASWGPPPDGPHRVVWAGRTGDPHGRELDPGLADIGVAEVLDQLGSLLGPVLDAEERRACV